MQIKIPPGERSRDPVVGVQEEGCGEGGDVTVVAATVRDLCSPREAEAFL